MKLPLTLFMIAVLSAIPSITSADTLMLEAAKDNAIFTGFGREVNSNGAGAFIFAGQTINDHPRRGLIAFDIGSIPAGSTVTSVTLRLEMTRTIAGSFDVSLHRLTADWGETTTNATGEEGGGAFAQPGDATWNDRASGGAPWSTPGGDFVSSASATRSVGDLGSYTWSSAGMVADVQGWVNGAFPNEGWILVGTEMPGLGATAKQFASRQHPAVSIRPQLTVEFAPVPEPASASLVLAAATLALRRRRGR